PPAPVTPVSPPPQVVPVTPPPDAGGRSMPRFASGIALAGVGAVGVGIGSDFGVRPFQKKGGVGTQCDQGGGCDGAGVTLQEDAHRSATISTITFGIGLAAVAAGVVLVVTSGSPAKPKASAWIAPSAGGIQVGGAW